MKTYKTWEMIKEIIENPKKKYRPVNDTDGYVEFKNNQLVWNGRGQRGQVMIVTETDENEWEEVKEPVDFITAVKSGKHVGYKYERGEIQKMSLPNLFYELQRDYSDKTIRQMILNGKWYIED